MTPIFDDALKTELGRDVVLQLMSSKDWHAAIDKFNEHSEKSPNRQPKESPWRAPKR